MSVVRLLRSKIRENPNASCAILPTAEGELRWTRAEFGEIAASLARQFCEHGVTEGDCIGVWLPNWTLTFAAQFAANALGAHVIGINTRYNVAEVANVVARARPKIILIAHDFVGLDLIGRIRRARAEALQTGADWCDPEIVPVAGPGFTVANVHAYDIGGGAWTLDDPAGEQLEDFIDIEGNLDVVAFTTSGTTGLPKLAAHDDLSVSQHAKAAARAMGLGPDDVFVCALPFSGTFGFSAAMSAIAAGSTLLMHPSFKPEELARDIATYGVTAFAFGDDMIARLHDEWERQHADFSTLRWVGIADFNGESQRLAQWLESLGTFVTGVYGSSEIFALTSVWSAATSAPQRWRGGGILVSNDMSLRLRNHDDKPVAAGEQGEIQFRGPNVVTRYLGQPEKMADNLTDDGWFRSGDLARSVDDRSFVYLCRMSDALRISGFLVEPDEIASHLMNHPAVELAKVVGVEVDTEMHCVGFAVARSGMAVTGTDLIAHCRDALARFKVPTAIFIIDEMPTTPSANGTKIKAVTLREWAQERLSTGRS